MDAQFIDRFVEPRAESAGRLLSRKAMRPEVAGLSIRRARYELPADVTAVQRAVG